MSVPQHSGNLANRNSGHCGGDPDNVWNYNQTGPRNFGYNRNKQRVNYSRPQGGNRRKHPCNGGGQQWHDNDSQRQQRDQSAHNQEARQASPPEPDKTAHNDDDIVKSYSCIPPNDVIGQIRAVHLQRFETKDMFICSLKDDIKLQELLEELQRDCNESEGQAYTGKLKCGEICCAKSSRDGKWHRVRVENVEHGEYYILDLDFGYAGKIECDSVRGMKRKFCRLPVQAFQCSLEGTKPDWRVEANEWLYHFINGGELFCWFKGPPKDSMYPVSLLIEKDLKDAAVKATDVEHLRENMQQVKALQSKQEDIGGITAVTATCLTCPQYTRITSLVKTVKEVTQVVISWVESKYEFYCYLKMHKDELDELNDKLQNVYGSGKGLVLRQLSPATPCVAKFSDDDMWYRAEIYTANGREVDVIFVDYGNIETVAVDDLRQITEEFVQFPAQAIHCIIPTPNHGKKLTDYDIDTEGAYYFLSYSNQCYKVEESNDNEEQQAFADKAPAASDEQNDDAQFQAGSSALAEVDIVDVEAKLVQTCEAAMKLDVPALQEECVEDVLVPEEIATVEIVELCTAINNVDLHDRLESSVINNLPCSRTKVYVIEPITSPVDFWVQIEDSTWNLSEKVGTVEDIPRKPLESVTEGMICASTYNDDGAWYRAKVITKDPDSSLTVLFIDYGNYETKQIAELFVLDSEAACIPPLAIRCQLSGIIFESPWTPEAIAKFEELTGQYEKSLLVEFSDSDTSPVPVRLLDCGIDVAKTLANLGFCSYVEPDDECAEKDVEDNIQDEKELTVDRTYSVGDEDNLLISSDVIVCPQDVKPEDMPINKDETNIAVESDKDVKDVVQSAETSLEGLIDTVSPNLDIDDKAKSAEEEPDCHSVIDLCSSVEILDASSIEPSICESNAEKEIDAEHDASNTEAESSVITISEEVCPPMCSDSSVYLFCLDETGASVTEELCDKLHTLECDDDIGEDSQITSLDDTGVILNSTNDLSLMQLQNVNVDGEMCPSDSVLSIHIDLKDDTQSTPGSSEDSVCPGSPSIQDVSAVTSVEGVAEDPSTCEIDSSSVDATSHVEHSTTEYELDEDNFLGNDISVAENDYSSIVCLEIDSVGSPEVCNLLVRVGVDASGDSSVSVVDDEQTAEGSSPNASEQCERIHLRECVADIPYASDFTNSDCSEEKFHPGEESRPKTGDSDVVDVSTSNIEDDIRFIDDSSHVALDSPRRLIKRVVAANRAMDCDESQSLEMTVQDDCHSYEVHELPPEQKAENSQQVLEVDTSSGSKREGFKLVHDRLLTTEDDNAKRSSLAAFDSDNEMSGEVEVKEVGVAEPVLTLSEDEKDSEDYVSSPEDEGSGDQVEDVRNAEEVEEMNGSAMTDGGSEDDGHEEVGVCAKVQADASGDEKLNGNASLTGSEYEEQDSDVGEEKSVSSSSGEETSSSSSSGEETSSSCCSEERESGVLASTDEDGGSSAKIIDTTSTDVSPVEMGNDECKGTSSSEDMKSSSSSDSEEGFVGDAEDEISVASDEGTSSASESANQVCETKDEGVIDVDIHVSASEDVPGDAKDEEVDICEGVKPLADSCDVEGDGDKKDKEFSMGEEEFFSTSEKFEDEQDNIGREEIASGYTDPSKKTCVGDEVEKVV